MEQIVSDETNNGSFKVTAKWGEGALGGFQQVPDLLLRKQENLGLNPTDLTVLLNITMQWWTPEDKPFSKAQTIARRMGASQRTVQRAISKMERSGLLRRERSNDMSTPGIKFDLSGLVDRLRILSEHDPQVLKRQGSAPQSSAT